jgi:hypothetical protein
LAWTVVDYFVEGDPTSLFGGIVYFLGLVPMFALLRWKYQPGLRYLPVFVFFVLATYSLAVSFSDEKIEKEGFKSKTTGAMDLFSALLFIGVVLC